MTDPNTLGEPKYTDWFVTPNKDDQTITLSFVTAPGRTDSIVWEKDEINDLIRELTEARKDIG